MGEPSCFGVMRLDCFEMGEPSCFWGLLPFQRFLLNDDTPFLGDLELGVEQQSGPPIKGGDLDNEAGPYFQVGRWR